MFSGPVVKDQFLISLFKLKEGPCSITTEPLKFLLRDFLTSCGCLPALPFPFNLRQKHLEEMTEFQL